jgi:putative resolvase
MKTYRVAKAAEIIGVSVSTLRRYTNDGLIKDTRNPAGQRIFTQESIDKLLGKNTPENTHLVFYVRASDGDDLKINNQIALLTKTFGQPERVFKDKASGLNEKRLGLQTLLNNAEKGNITTVAITQKDRLTRFGYTYLEQLLAVYKVKIIVLSEEASKTPREELLQDFMSLVVNFSGKLYRLRGYQQQEQLLLKAGDTLAEKKSNS